MCGVSEGHDRSFCRRGGAFEVQELKEDFSWRGIWIEPVF